MLCPKCGKQTEMHVKVGLSIPSDMAGKLSKSRIRNKDVDISWADWDTAYVECDCGWVGGPFFNETKGVLAKISYPKTVKPRQNTPPSTVQVVQAMCVFLGVPFYTAQEYIYRMNMEREEVEVRIPMSHVFEFTHKMAKHGYVINVD